MASEKDQWIGGSDSEPRVAASVQLFIFYLHMIQYSSYAPSHSIIARLPS